MLWDAPAWPSEDRKSTRLNSSHDQISYAVFCLRKKKNASDTKKSLTKKESDAKQRSPFFCQVSMRFSSLAVYSSVRTVCRPNLFFFFFNDTATTEIYTLSLHDALPI